MINSVEPLAGPQQGYVNVKLLRWRGTEERSGVIAVTPDGEEAIRKLLEAAGIVAARGRAGLVCVRDVWAQGFLFMLTEELIQSGQVCDEAAVHRKVEFVLTSGVSSLCTLFRKNASGEIKPLNEAQTQKLEGN